MPIIKSQKKRVLTNELRRQRNIAVRSRVKTVIKSADVAIEAKDSGKAKEELLSALSAIDRAQSKGVFNANQAARRKSSLQRRYNQI